MRKSIALIEEILILDKKAAESPEQRFMQYKQEHPQTQKNVSDPQFVGSTDSGIKVPHPSHEVYHGALDNPAELKKRLPNWSSKDHEDASSLHNRKGIALKAKHTSMLAQAERGYLSGAKSKNHSGDGTDNRFPENVNSALKAIHHDYTLHNKASDTHKALVHHPELKQQIEEMK